MSSEYVRLIVSLAYFVLLFLDGAFALLEHAWKPADALGAATSNALMAASPITLILALFAVLRPKWPLVVAAGYETAIVAAAGALVVFTLNRGVPNSAGAVPSDVTSMPWFHAASYIVALGNLIVATACGIIAVRQFRRVSR